MNTFRTGLYFALFPIFILISTPLFSQDPDAGTALNFDGVDDYVYIGNDPNLIFPETSPFTIEAWVKPSVDNITGQIFTKFNLTVTGDYSLSVFNGVPATHRETAPYSVSGTTVFKKDTWYHIASVYNGTSLSIHVNGIEEGSIISGSIDGTPTDVLIGARLQNGNPGGYHILNFNAENLASGIYLYRFQADNFVQTRKMLLIQ